MLNPKNIPRKTYEELMEENYGKIPIYSSEWTNYNPSDPGITIMENLSALQIIQQDKMYEVTDGVRARLLQLVGYSPKRGSGAKVYLEPSGLKEKLLIPADKRYMVGDISFENTLAREMTASHLTGIYGKVKNEITNYSYLLEKDLTISAPIFGKKTENGAMLYLVLDAPLEAGEKGTVYIEADNRYGRNDFVQGQEALFGTVCWECYTEEGFVPMEVCEESYGFLKSTYFTFTQPQQKAAYYKDDQIEGYVWRATLKDAAYDTAPIVRKVSGFLFPVVQKETLVITHSFQKSSGVELDCNLVDNAYVRVFCKEQKGTSYKMYAECLADGDSGRFYDRERLDNGNYAFRFDRERYGYAPEHVKNAVKIVLYNEEMMRKYFLGEIYGYDNQEIKLPKEHVVTETFSVIAERMTPEGELVYDFLKPGRMGEKELSYHLYENDGKIVILDAGDYVGAKLYLGSIAVTLGEEGNVRAGNTFFPLEPQEGIRYTNPAAGEGGCFQEDLESVRKRFVADMNTIMTAVMASDYEELVRKTPGLCIGKVNAWMDYSRNEVQVAVMPGLPESFPQLSRCYITEIEEWIDKHRLLSTRVHVRQPVYSAVVVKGTIYVKPHFEGCRQQIEAVITRELDYINGEQHFGQVLRFDRLFHQIEALDGVSYIYELSMAPQNSNYAVMDGADIRPMPNCLLYPGNMRLEVLPSPEERS